MVRVAAAVGVGKEELVRIQHQVLELEVQPVIPCPSAFDNRSSYSLQNLASYLLVICSLVLL